MEQNIMSYQLIWTDKFCTMHFFLRIYKNVILIITPRLLSY